jgi:hypothetical protein
VNVLTYNIKLVSSQKLELLIFPALMSALALGVWYSSGDKPTGSRMLLEVISPLVLGLLVTDIISREAKWKTAEITLAKSIPLARILYLRYALVLLYGMLILSVISLVFSFSIYSFEMKSLIASIPPIMVITSMSLFLSIMVGQNIAAFGIIFFFLIEGSAGPRYLPLFLFLETFSPNYKYFWINRGVFLIISVIVLILVYYLSKNPERIMR